MSKKVTGVTSGNVCIYSVKRFNFCMKCSSSRFFLKLIYLRGHFKFTGAGNNLDMHPAYCRNA